MYRNSISIEFTADRITTLGKTVVCDILTKDATKLFFDGLAPQILTTQEEVITLFENIERTPDMLSPLGFSEIHDALKKQTKYNPLQVLDNIFSDLARLDANKLDISELELDTIGVFGADTVSTVKLIFDTYLKLSDPDDNIGCENAISELKKYFSELLED